MMTMDKVNRFSMAAVAGMIVGCSSPLATRVIAADGPNAADGPQTTPAEAASVHDVVRRIRGHEFHPLGRDGSMTVDRQLGVDGVADMNDRDGRVRMLAIADLVRRLPDHLAEVTAALRDENPDVRQVAAAALGIGRQGDAVAPLQQLLSDDPSPIVRSQAAISLGQMGSMASLKLLRETRADDRSRDVRHQCELAADRIVKGRVVSDAHRAAVERIGPDSFGTVAALEPAPDFELRDTDDRPWRLSEVNRNKWVVLIWIFADWCPVCHGEFRDLIDSQAEFAEAGVEVATLECHDRYRCRVMVGKELSPEYWFSDRPFRQRYESGVWWPHLVDHAGAVAARYGAEPMSFAVHAEYINRPTTVIIDPSGVVRFVYRGTYWGDRPTIAQTLDMIRHQRFDFEHPNRRKQP